MANQEMWAQRVSAWKASGLTSTAYCEGKPFTPGGLRYWASRLSGRQLPVPVRVARIVRLPEVKPPPPAERRPEARSEAVEQRPDTPARRPGRGGADVAADLVLEIGAARVAVRPGFDRATLAALLEVLAADSGSGR